MNPSLQSLLDFARLNTLLPLDQSLQTTLGILITNSTRLSTESFILLPHPLINHFAIQLLLHTEGHLPSPPLKQLLLDSTLPHDSVKSDADSVTTDDQIELS